MTSATRKSPLEILADLRERDLYDLCDETARRYRVSLADVCSRSMRGEVVQARHAVWLRLHRFYDGNCSAVARLWGANHTTILAALREAEPDVVHVVLASYESDDGHHAFRFEWVRGRVNPYAVTDRVADLTTWFPTYELAREVYEECLRTAGVQTIRSHSDALLAADRRDELERETLPESCEPTIPTMGDAIAGGAR